MGDIRPIIEAYSKGRKMVMVAHPGCGYCHRAFENMSAKVRTFLKTNGTIITPIRRNSMGEDLQRVDRWNQNQPFYHHKVFSDAQLPGPIVLNSYPQFYFFKNGKKVHHSTGWAGDNSHNRVLEKIIANF